MGRLSCSHIDPSTASESHYAMNPESELLRSAKPVIIAGELPAVLQQCSAHLGNQKPREA